MNARNHKNVAQSRVALASSFDYSQNRNGYNWPATTQTERSLANALFFAKITKFCKNLAKVAKIVNFR